MARSETLHPELTAQPYSNSRTPSPYRPSPCCSTTELSRSVEIRPWTVLLGQPVISLRVVMERGWRASIIRSSRRSALATDCTSLFSCGIKNASRSRNWPRIQIADLHILI